MCGIIGYVGEREAKPLLLQGLKRLEYRGYDSAGIALREDKRIEYVRAVGNLENLVEVVGPNGSTSKHGLGHTRWATHGGVTERNAHPLVGCDAAKLAIVLNGIVENYRELKEQLEADGHRFTSETDAEVVVHLLEREYDGDLTAALMRVYPWSVSAKARCSSPRRSPRSSARRVRRTSRSTARSSRSLRQADGSSSTATRCSASPKRSCGTRRSPRRAATRPSC
jgi:glutamine phosphoribosylpyrophosphate amidotransferase